MAKNISKPPHIYQDFFHKVCGDNHKKVVTITGKPFAKVIHVVAKQVHKTKEPVIKHLDRSVPLIRAAELYGDQPKEVIMVVVEVTQNHHLRDMVHLHDSHTLMIVTDARAVVGHGFELVAASTLPEAPVSLNKNFSKSVITRLPKTSNISCCLFFGIAFSGA